AMLSKTVKEQDVFWWWKKIRQAWLGDLGLTQEPVSVLPEVIALEPISGKASRSAGAAVRPIV
ncbi:MAG: trehalose-6-phosphate synthase, partial [Eubacteriales bacterium]